MGEGEGAGEGRGEGGREGGREGRREGRGGRLQRALLANVRRESTRRDVVTVACNCAEVQPGLTLNLQLKNLSTDVFLRCFIRTAGHSRSTYCQISLSL